MWILLTLIGACFNALWTSLSKFRLQQISPYSFTIYLRLLAALYLLPFSVLSFHISLGGPFWLWILSAAFFEAVGIYTQAAGIKRDFYSTYTLANTSPLFTLLIAFLILSEKINLILIIGAVLIVIGGVIFYGLQGRFSIYGLTRAICSACSGICGKIAVSYSSPLFYPPLMFLITAFLLLVNPFARGKINRSEFRRGMRLVFFLGGFSAIATMAYYTAIDLAPVTRVNPLIRINLIFGFIMSYFILKEREDLSWKIFGSLFILLGAICISLSL